jgi:hypothetical protein
VGNDRISPHDAVGIARAACEAYKAGREIDFHRVDGKIWCLALDWLIDQALLDVVAFAAPRAAAAHPQTRLLKSLAAILARLPPPCDDPVFAAFRDDATKEVQIVPRAGATTVLLGFCGAANRMGMPLNLMHRWFGRLGVHVIYLRDYRGRNYDEGIASLAGDLGGTLLALRQTIAGLGATRAVCYGNSLGSYGALRYGLELPAKAVLCFGAPTNLTPGFGNTPLRDQRGVATGLDLRPLYERAGTAPRTRLVYSEFQPYDRAQAENFAGLPTVSLQMVPGVRGHDVFLHVLFQGQYEGLLRWLVDPPAR